MPHHFLNRQVELHQQRLLRAGYKCVLFTEVDEFIVPDPILYPNGLRQYFKEFITSDDKNVIVVNGYHVGHVPTVEPKIDVTKPIIKQRNYWYQDDNFSKPLLTKIPLRYVHGFHYAHTRTSYTTGNRLYAYEHPNIVDRNIYMFHLHSFDYEFCTQREYNKFKGSQLSHNNDEEYLGIHVYSVLHVTLDPVLSKISICGLAMLHHSTTTTTTTTTIDDDDSNDDEVIAPLGEIATRIPDKFHVIDL